MMDLELALQELNDVVVKQYQDIEQLQRANAHLFKQLQQRSEPDAEDSLSDEVPPHY